MLWLRGSIGKGGADTAWFQGEYGIVHSLPLMSKGEEKDKRKSIAEEEYCHQCQRGRLLEMFNR
jgi:hypothetical protein